MTKLFRIAIGSTLLAGIIGTIIHGVQTEIRIPFTYPLPFPWGIYSYFGFLGFWLLMFFVTPLKWWWKD